MARTIAGREVVFWRDAGGDLVAGPALCPHLGALHGQVPGAGRHDVLPLARDGVHRRRAIATWSPYRAYDDGVLIWVGLPTAGETLDRATDAAGPAAAERVGDAR